MNKMLPNLTTFSANNEKPYEQMRDYFFHYMSVKGGKKYGDFDASVSLDEKEKKMHEALMSEITRVSGQTIPNGMDMAHFSMNPMIKWASFSVIDAMIDAVLPETIIDLIGVYTDIRPVGFGDSASFTVEPRSIYTVSQGSNAQRTGFIHKQFATTRTMTAVNHTITVAVSLYAVLAGQEDIGRFVRKAIISLETQMTLDAYGSLNAGLTAVSVPAALTQTGYTQAGLLKLCNTVTAYNQGAKAVIVGTSSALANVLPSSANGYRIVTDSDSMNIQLIKNFFDYDVLVLPQVATGASDYGLALDDTKIYVVSPTSDKLIKGVIEGSSLSNSNDFYENANLTQNATLNKRWNFEWLSNATAGIVKLS